MVVTSLSLSCIGEGNGNPLQCSCLENPRDGSPVLSAGGRVGTSVEKLFKITKCILQIVFGMFLSLFPISSDIITSY